MNWKKIQHEWENGNKEIAIRLLRSMIYEAGLRQTQLSDFNR